MMSDVENSQAAGRRFSRFDDPKGAAEKVANDVGSPPPKRKASLRKRCLSRQILGNLARQDLKNCLLKLRRETGGKIPQNGSNLTRQYDPDTKHDRGWILQKTIREHVRMLSEAAGCSPLTCHQ
jgi:hypothetical protein